MSFWLTWPLTEVDQPSGALRPVVVCKRRFPITRSCMYGFTPLRGISRLTIEKFRIISVAGKVPCGLKNFWGGYAAESN
jgi:hypothetical protein